jgi:hypothetical protein
MTINPRIKRRRQNEEPSLNHAPISKQRLQESLGWMRLEFGWKKYSVENAILTRQGGQILSVSLPNAKLKIRGRIKKLSKTNYIYFSWNKYVFMCPFVSKIITRYNLVICHQNKRTIPYSIRTVIFQGWLMLN